MSNLSTSGSLRTQASLDLVNLAKWPVTFTYDALVRFSKANIDVSTVAAGQLTCACFGLSARAQHEVGSRLESRTATALYGKVVWVGFGLRHILDDLADRESGMNCIALCGCLVDSYPPFFGAQVLRKLCQLRNVKEDLVPGTQRWQGLLKVTAGIFTSSRFSVLVHIFSRLLVPTTRFGVVQRGATDPEALADGLLQLARIITGELQSCTFSGGLDCAWLAAVAAFLFNFRTEIRARDGTCLYRYHPLYCLEESCVISALPCKHQNAAEHENYVAQVIVFPSEATTTGVALTTRSFSVPNGRELFRESLLGFQNVVEFNSRSPWTSILQDSFGAAATDLLEGAAAQHFAGFFAFNAERAVRMRSRDSFATSDESFAWPNLTFAAQMLNVKASLFQIAMRRLPELQPCFISFLEASKANASISETDAVNHIQAIQTQCGCPACIGTQVPVQQFTCLRALAGTLVLYSSLLSIANVHKEVLPTPFGLRKLYDASQPLNDRIFGESPSWRHRWCPNISDPLKSIFNLFSTAGNTHTMSDNFKQALSLSADGLCCYYRILENPNSEPSDASRVVVIPGHIAFQSAVYERIDNLKLEEEQWIQPKPLPLLDYSLYLSESMQEHLLYTAYQARNTSVSQISPGHMFSVGSVCHFAAQKGLQGEGRRCSERVRLLDHHFQDVPESADSNDPDEDPEEWFEESYWNVEFPVGPSVAIDALNSCSSDEVDNHAQYCLLVIVADPQACDNIKIFKSNCSSNGQLYAEFARKYRMPLDSFVQYEIVRITDCPRCILCFVADVWPHRMGTQIPLPDNSIRGQIVYFSFEDSLRGPGGDAMSPGQTLEFELHRDRTFTATPPRRRPLVDSLHEKPSPPSPRRLESALPTLSTFAKHFKNFIVGVSTVEVGLERLLQYDC